MIESEIDMRIENIQPLSEFTRNTKQMVSALKESGEPLLLTVNGKPEIVVLDAKRYQEMEDMRVALELDRKLEEARLEIAEGKGIPLEQVRQNLMAKRKF